MAHNKRIQTQQGKEIEKKGHSDGLSLDVKGPKNGRERRQDRLWRYANAPAVCCSIETIYATI